MTRTELFKVLSEQILSLLTTAPQNCVEIRDFGPMFHKFYGHNIHIEEYEVESLEDLIAKIPHVAHVSKIRFVGQLLPFANKRKSKLFHYFATMCSCKYVAF